MGDNLGFRAHVHTPPAGPVGLTYTLGAIDQGGCRQVGTRQVLHQAIDADVRVIDHCQAGIDHFIEIMRRYVGRHTHGNAGGAVDQQLGNTCRQHRRFRLGTVVVIDEIDRLLVEVGQQFMRDF